LDSFRVRLGRSERTAGGLSSASISRRGPGRRDPRPRLSFGGLHDHLVLRTPGERDESRDHSCIAGERCRHRTAALVGGAREERRVARAWQEGADTDLPVLTGLRELETQRRTQSRDSVPRRRVGRVGEKRALADDGGHVDESALPLPAESRASPLPQSTDRRTRPSARGSCAAAARPGAV